MTGDERIQWLQDVYCLHVGIDILYVVDGYEVSIVLDHDHVLASTVQPTLAEAIDELAAKYPDMGAINELRRCYYIACSR